jgi:hypothetical protein
MNTFDKKIAEVFEVIPSETVPKKTLMPTVHSDDDDLKQDLVDAYNQSKDNLQEIIDQGKDAMEEILVIAKAGQHPRAFEVYGTLLKNMVDANKELLNIQKQMRDIEKPKESQKTNTTIDKAIFVGSTSELSKLIKGK